MYRGYCISEATIDEIAIDYLYDDDMYGNYVAALEELDIKSNNITSNIAKILKGDARGIIDGESLLQACMPTKTDKYDVFISHSHLSEDYAKDLAAYLRLKYGVKCFVDGFVWGSCDKEILRPIDNIWSKHDTIEGSYSYEKRNYSTSHVHAMLSMALLEMMDQCECCIFIIPEDDYKITGINDYTLSPWIYEEITMFNKVEKQDPKRTRRICESYSDSVDKLSIRYKLDLSDMPELKPTHLKKYITIEENQTDYTRAYRWLDCIYESLKC